MEKLVEILWHDQNTEPPKRYLWAKEDGTYKYDYTQHEWVKSESSDSENNSVYKELLRNIQKFYYSRIAALTESQDVLESESHLLKPSRIYINDIIDYTTTPIGYIDLITNDVSIPDSVNIDNLDFNNDFIFAYTRTDVQQLLDFIDITEGADQYDLILRQNFNVIDYNIRIGHYDLPSIDNQPTEVPLSDGKNLRIGYINDAYVNLGISDYMG